LKYEYAVILVYAGDESNAAAVLNEWAEAGWSPILASTWGSNTVYTLARPKDRSLVRP
jgi:hypothetical protein